MSFGLLFLFAVLAEVASLVIVGSELGVLYTFGLLVVSFGLGFALLSGRGIATVKNALGANQEGTSPTPALIDGALLALAGLLFVTPGFASDAVALLLVIPPVRWVVRDRIVAWGRARIGQLPVVKVPGNDARIAEHDVIDVDATEVPPRDPDRPRLPR